MGNRSSCGQRVCFYIIVGFLITSDINKTVQAPEKAQKAAERVEHYLEEKYGEDFNVQTGAEWIARSEQTRTVLHIADTWTRGNNRLQDDYELQRLVQPIVKKILGDQKFVYDIQYANTDFYKLYWAGKNEQTMLLSDRANRDVSLDIHFYDDDPNVPEYLARFEKLASELRIEHFDIANLSVSKVKQEYLQDSFLMLSNEERQTLEIETYRFESD